VSFDNRRYFVGISSLEDLGWRRRPKQQELYIVNHFSIEASNIIVGFRLTLNVEVGAFGEETKSFCPRASSDKMAERSGQDALTDISCVSSIGRLVTARELRLVTTLCLSLLHGHVVRNGEVLSEGAFIAGG